MRLYQNRSSAAQRVSKPCFVCGRVCYVADMVADLDGPAFTAYYCPEHIPVPCRDCGEITDADGLCAQCDGLLDG